MVIGQVMRGKPDSLLCPLQIDSWVFEFIASHFRDYIYMERCWHLWDITNAQHSG